MSQYNLETIKLPKMTGNMLSLFANLIETKFGKMLLLNTLLENGGIPKLRTNTANETPAFYPLQKADTNSSAANQPLEFPLTENKTPYATSLNYADKYRKTETTPEAVAEQVWRNIKSSEQGEQALRIFIAVKKDDLFSQAEAATKRIKQGIPLSLLDGVPVAIKDELDMLPYPTTVGTSFYGKQPALEDSTVAARLRAAGALLVGKTNMHEIGIAPNGMNAHYGAVRNPYDPNHDTGGSSSGSAAAVAAGIVPIAIGADGGGSIRIPAALCGVVGFKATFGRISEFGAAPLCWSVAHVGPIAASVADTALAYSIIAGPDPKDPNTSVQPAVSLDGWNIPHLEGLRLGVYPAWNEHADPEVVLAFKEMLAAFIKRGGNVVEIEIPELDEMRIAHSVTILAEMATVMRAEKAHRKEMAESVRLSLVLGEEMAAGDYVQAQRIRARALTHFEKIYQQVDVILSPATAKAAPQIPVSNSNQAWSDLSTDIELMRYVFPGNLTGLPAISFPVGYTTQGLPVGMQAMGNHWQENLLLRVAFNAEQVLERQAPAHFYPTLLD